MPIRQDRFQVYAAARSVEKMDDLAKLSAVPLRIDISREQEIKSAVEAIMGGSVVWTC
jgi:hypothetical protein